MDHASRLLVRSAAKLLIDAANHGTMLDEERSRVIAAYRRLLLALGVERKKSEQK